MSSYGLKQSLDEQTQQQLLELAVLNAQQDLLIKQQRLLSQQIITLTKELAKKDVKIS
jgi:hypothetical protein